MRLATVVALVVLGRLGLAKAHLVEVAARKVVELRLLVLLAAVVVAAVYKLGRYRLAY